MSKRFEKLKTLLKELFQLDQPDLDFGLYRIMHAKADEITQFLDRDLLPQVREAFGEYRTADKAELEKELKELIAGIEKAGMDPAASPKVQELKQRIADDAVDVDALENEVYDHLFRFFRRYYHEGDYLAKRVYKPGVYAIPYEGEEVKLHWANRDQYYIKTSEYLRDYAFKLQPHNDQNPMRVHFRIVDAAEGEHGNVKPSNGGRVFILAKDDFISEEDGELVIRFEYRPATMDDWTEEARAKATAAAAKKPPVQKDLIAIAVDRALTVEREDVAKWVRELAKPHTKANGERADYSRLEGHLKRYTARNTFDYFIHKELGGFLRRELDFYIKNEVMHLDDVESETAPRVEQYLSKIKVIRKIAGKVIDFLAQLEDFQRTLWLKKKFVVETSWCIRLGCISEEFYPEIAANVSQHEEWVEQLGIDKPIGEGGRTANAASPLFDASSPIYTSPLSIEFLKSHPTLMVDTRHLSVDLATRLLDSFDDVGGMTDGVLVHSENFQGLSLMHRTYRKRCQCVYIDPPYNSKTTEILYKNNYKHSSWLSLMDSRLALSADFETEDGSHVVAIDENEQEVLGQLLTDHFPTHEKVCVAVVHNKKGIQGSYFSYNHEYAYFCISPHLTETNGTPIDEDDWEYDNLRKWGRESERETARNCFYPIFVKDDHIIGFGEVCDGSFHPGAANVKLDDCIAVYPVDGQSIERKWRYARNSVENILSLLKVKKTTSGEIQIHKAKAERQIKTVWDDPRYIAGDYGTRWLTDLGVKVSDTLYPKSLHTVEDSVFAVSGTDAVVLDYFGGSGTTAHAVIALNRRDGGSRRFVVVEMGEHFDSVLVPRLKKVTFTADWRNGKPLRMPTQEDIQRSPRLVKILRIESYEDTLNNLEIRRQDEQQSLLNSAASQGSDGLKEQYVLRYMLNVETRGSQSLLNVRAFTDPTAYRLKVKAQDGDEAREVNIDLLETFNWLLGMTVKHIAAPQSFHAEFERDDEKRLRLKGRLRQSEDGLWWFRTVTGTLPDGKQALVIWRKLTGNVEEDNLVLDEWFVKQGYSTKDYEFDVVYVNVDNNLDNLRQPDDTWKVRLIEDDFHRLMFESGEG